MNTPTIDWRQRAQALKFDGRAFIAGQRVAAQSGQTFDCVSPLDGRVLTAVARSGAADVDAAVATARKEGVCWGRSDALLGLARAKLKLNERAAALALINDVTAKDTQHPVAQWMQDDLRNADATAKK